VIVDSHCHLADEAFDADRAAVIQRAQAAGLSRALCILTADDEAELARGAGVRTLWPAVDFAAAVHPHRAGVFAGREAEAVDAARAAASRMDAVALGEMGLDYHYDFAPRDVQRTVFAGQVALAVEMSLPIVIHTREAFDDTLAVIADAGGGRSRGVMHCFTGTADEARRALDNGFYISLSGILTFPRAGDLREVAKLVPLDCLLVETDSPYLAPVPYRGKRNEPAWVGETASTLAGLHGLTLEAMDANLSANDAAFVGRDGAATPG
jgi:TatD DNase family protein